MKLSILYHVAIMDVFRPYIQQPEPPTLRTWASGDSTPDAIFNASVNQLWRLILTYRSNYRSATHTILWHTSCLYVANASLNNQSDPNRLYYFHLCVQGYLDLVRSFPLAGGVIQGLLTMAMKKGVMSSAQARKLAVSSSKSNKGASITTLHPNSDLNSWLILIWH